MLEFEWSEYKAASNARKHGVSFITASKVFLDTNRLEFQDNRKDYDEDRFITIGQVEEWILVIVFTYRQEKIRIISARKGTLYEQKKYYNFQA